MSPDPIFSPPSPTPTNIESNVTRGPYDCEICKILFNSEEELEHHKQEVHKEMISQAKKGMARRKGKTKTKAADKRKGVSSRRNTSNTRKKRRK